MNYNEKIRKEGKIIEKRECTFKITDFSAAYNPRVLNLVLYKF